MQTQKHIEIQLEKTKKQIKHQKTCANLKRVENTTTKSDSQTMQATKIIVENYVN